MKILFNKEIKRISDCTDYETLKEKCKTSFNIKNQDLLKFYYIDSDFDVISVTNTDDLVEALNEHSEGRLRMAIADDGERAREILSSDGQLASTFRSQI